MQRKILRSWAKAKIEGLENIRSFVNLLLKYKIFIVPLILLIILPIYFWDITKMLILMAVFFGVGVGSMYYMKYIKFPLGIELNLLGVVLITTIYGPIPGAILGVITLFIAELITERLTHSTAISFLGLIVVSLLIPNLPNDWSITTLGIMVTVIYDLIIIPLYILLGSSISRSGIFMATHILFNFWVFSYLAPQILKVIG